MGDFPPEWPWERDLEEGGQGYTFVVRRAGDPHSVQYVLKRLKNPKRQDYFEREIEACTRLDHPNILKVLSHGLTPKGRPFLITEYCSGGSLNGSPKFDDPGKGLRFFQHIVAGVAHAHAHAPPIYHLDLKPENILLKGGTPVVGDFGICFIDGNELAMTSEGPRGSIYYCAPELRGPKLPSNPAGAASDVYSLGKILYWLFTHDVYDGHEEDYADVPERKLARLFPAQTHFAFIDELVAQTVRRDPAKRITTAVELESKVTGVAKRIEAGGRVLDLRTQQRCLYCAVGHYRPAHDQIHIAGLPMGPKFPTVEMRKNPPKATPFEQVDIYKHLRAVGKQMVGSEYIPMPLFLVCDYCGNVQYFRLDLSSHENWLP